MTKNSKLTLADQDPIILLPLWINKYAILSIRLYGDMSRAFEILDQDKKKAKA